MWGIAILLFTSFIFYGIYCLTGSIIIAIVLFTLYMMYLPGNSWWIRSSRFFQYARETHHRVKYVGPGVHLLSDISKPYCFGMHPHGPHAVAAIVGIGSNLNFTNVRVVTSTVLFWIPIVKEFIGWGNCVKADLNEMHNALKGGTSLALFPAGIRETPGLFPEKQRGNPLYVYPRKSFIRIAKDNNVPIVPVWIDGEYHTHTVYWPFLHFSQQCYKMFRYPFPLTTLGWCGTPLPKPVPLTFHVGNAIETTNKSVDELCKLFYSKLVELQ